MASRSSFGFIGLKLHVHVPRIRVVVPIKLHRQLRLIKTVKPGSLSSASSSSRKDASSTIHRLLGISSRLGVLNTIWCFFTETRKTHPDSSLFLRAPMKDEQEISYPDASQP
jgi:hypothetical protein